MEPPEISFENVENAVKLSKVFSSKQLSITSHHHHLLLDRYWTQTLALRSVRLHFLYCPKVESLPMNMSFTHFLLLFPQMPITAVKIVEHTLPGLMLLPCRGSNGESSCPILSVFWSLYFFIFCLTKSAFGDE